MKEKLDLFLNKWLSRKLMVFFVATALAVVGRVESNDWVDVAIVYIGIEGLADIVGRLRGYGFGRNNRGKDTAI